MSALCKYTYSQMWNLDDTNLYLMFARVEIPSISTWGNDDRSKREDIRKAAVLNFPPKKPDVMNWAFRIFAQGPNNFDVDNIPKIIIDAFSTGQIIRDRSLYTSVGLYEDDTARHVSMVQVAGVQVTKQPLTVVEIYGCKQGIPNM